MNKKVKIAGMQMEPVIGDKGRNMARCLELINTAAREDAQLIVFPEAALSGYIYNSIDEVIPITESIPGPSTEAISALCHQMNVHVIIGILEEDQGRYYNTAALIGPEGLVGKYRKLHLPYIGADRFLNHGNLSLKVYDTELGRIGMGICYDLSFPEHARILTLLGADIIVNITNSPEGLEFNSEHTVFTRARENNVFIVYINRIGDERGCRFFGQSKITDCFGKCITQGKSHEEDILYAEIDPTTARHKLRVTIPGERETDTISDRRPEFYSVLTQPLVDSSRIR
ncbi:carbon-nitrogen hydrolase family protein [Chloroflexota bacterium]